MAQFPANVSVICFYVFVFYVAAFNNWDSDEPTTRGHCAKLNPTLWKWKAEKCAASLPYICQRGQSFSFSFSSFCLSFWWWLYYGNYYFCYYLITRTFPGTIISGVPASTLSPASKLSVWLCSSSHLPGSLCWLLQCSVLWFAVSSPCTDTREFQFVEKCYSVKLDAVSWYKVRYIISPHSVSGYNLT